MKRVSKIIMAAAGIIGAASVVILCCTHAASITQNIKAFRLHNRKHCAAHVDSGEAD
mgnify:CR=1